MGSVFQTTYAVAMSKALSTQMHQQSSSVTNKHDIPVTTFNDGIKTMWQEGSLIVMKLQSYHPNLQPPSALQSFTQSVGLLFGCLVCNCIVWFTFAALIVLFSF